MMCSTNKIAVIGDIHLNYDNWDNSFFNRSDYDLVLFVGDLSEFGKPRKGLEVAGILSHLNKPAIFLPGNHDVHNSLQFIAEIINCRILSNLSSYYHFEYHERLTAKLNPMEVGGYSLHPFQGENAQFDILSSRPFAMGGSKFSYSPILRKMFGVRNLEQSTGLLCKLVDLSDSENLIFLAHNGPTGLGEGPSDIWGCDFDPIQGDFGDKDLEDAIQHALEIGKRVLAVVAGHMHLQTYYGPKPIWQRRGEPGPERPFMIEKEGIIYVNSARVPRIFIRDDNKVHHHFCMEISGSKIEVREVFWERDNTPSEKYVVQ